MLADNNDATSEDICKENHSVAHGKIIFYTDVAGLGGGVETYLQLLAAACVGHYEVICFRRGGSPLDILEQNLATCGVRVVQGPSFLRWLSKASVTCPTLVHVNSCSRCNRVLEHTLIRLRSIGLVITIHSVPPLLPPPMGLRRFAPWRLRLGLRHCRQKLEWTLAHRLIVLSPVCRLRLGLQRWPRCDIVYNGVDTCYFCPDVSTRKQVRSSLGTDARVIIGSAGRFSGEKAYHRLIEAMANMTRRDVGLLLLGDGPERERLVSLSKKLVSCQP